MKIQKQFVSKSNGKEYYKHVVILPEDAIKESDFKEGDELEVEVRKGEIKLKKK